MDDGLACCTPGAVDQRDRVGVRVIVEDRDAARAAGLPATPSSPTHQQSCIIGFENGQAIRLGEPSAAETKVAPGSDHTNTLRYTPEVSSRRRRRLNLGESAAAAAPDDDAAASKSALSTLDALKELELKEDAAAAERRAEKRASSPAISEESVDDDDDDEAGGGGGGGGERYLPPIDEVEHTHLGCSYGHGHQIERFLSRARVPRGTMLAWRMWVGRQIESRGAHVVLGLAICANALMIGYETNHRAALSQQASFDDGLDDPYLEPWFALNMAFLAIFVAELLAKLFAFRRLYFADNWNCFDLFIIACAIVDGALDLDHRSGHKRVRPVGLRVVRLLRLLRLFEFLERLQVLANAFLQALRSVFWVAVMITIFLYVAAIVAVNTFGESRVDSETARDFEERVGAPIDDYFGTVQLAMATLMQAREREASARARARASAGEGGAARGVAARLRLVSWGSLARDLADFARAQVMTLDSWMSGVVRPLGVTNWLAWPFLILVMLVFTIGFLNLMTAIFVESIMLNHDKVERRRYDSNRKAERQCGECAATLFRLLKVSGDHSLSRAQLLDTLGLLAKRQYAANHGEPVLDDEVTDALVRLAPTNTDWESVLRAVYQDPRDSERGRLTRHDFEALLLHAREPTIRQDTWSVESQLEELQCTFAAQHAQLGKRVDELATRTEAQFQHIARALEKLAR